MNKNTDLIKANWTELKGKVKKYWGKITDDEVTQLEGSAEELKGILEKKYNYKNDQIDKEINAFLKENKIETED